MAAAGWLVWRFRGSLYQVGRLAVLPLRLLTAPDPQFWYDERAAAALGVGFRRDDPVLSLHIPSTGPLTAEECDEALGRLGETFARWFDDGPPVLAVCTSWTLDDQLGEYLPDTSNLMAWQRRFTLVPGGADSDSIVSHVFGDLVGAPLDQLPTDTTLRRAVVSHLREGRHWRVRTGWLRL